MKHISVEASLDEVSKVWIDGYNTRITRNTEYNRCYRPNAYSVHILPHL